MLQSAKPQISILLVAYHSRKVILPCLKGIFQHTKSVRYEVLFLDNSNDGSEQLVATEFSSVQVIKTEKNLGYGGGNNFLARHAHANLFLILNPDTLVIDNAIGHLYESSKQFPRAGAWGGLCRLANGHLDPGCFQRHRTLKMAIGNLYPRLPRNRSRHHKQIETHIYNVPILNGAFLMIGREIWEILSGFDETFFMYTEEVDLCYRIRKKGLQLILTKNACIIHLGGSGDRKNPQRILSIMKGSMHLAWKHYSPLVAITFGILGWGYCFQRWLAGAIGYPWVDQKKAMRYRQAYAPIVFAPQKWWNGWRGSQTG